ncbi:hypothetical protein SASPL_154255 [Salvia splendens]|uniref:Serine/threonine-protein phosphatase 2A regulatory subunit B n=1 Tax=Salvia splendens TaxID=180675 RepID=A0A8X8VZT4_SALSN|nr:hypothetical protein SASPL_154255 [Salvia splendens]
MIKNFLNKIPKKQVKSAESRDGGSSTLSSAPSTASRINSASSARSANGGSPPVPYEALPGFRDVPSAEKQHLFIRKLSMCCVVFDFTDPTKHLKEKDIKRQTLVELVDYVSSADGKFSDVVLQEIVRVVSTNLFRTLPTQPRENKVLEGLDVEEEEP